MSWLAAELMIPEEMIQIYVANVFTYSTDIQPCQMCARLKEAAAILEDIEGTQIEAMGLVISEFAVSAAPPSPAQMASIAAVLNEHSGDGSYYAAAGQWLDALAEYVGILVTEMGMSQGEAVNAVTKYVMPVAEGENAALAAYVAAHLVLLGG